MLAIGKESQAFTSTNKRVVIHTSLFLLMRLFGIGANMKRQQTVATDILRKA